MYNLKFFSRAPTGGVIPTYRAMTAVSYEISPPMSMQQESYQFADVVMHLPDGSCVTWPLKGNDVLYVENQFGTTIDKISNPAGTMPEAGPGYHTWPATLDATTPLTARDPLNVPSQNRRQSYEG